MFSRGQFVIVSLICCCAWSSLVGMAAQPLLQCAMERDFSHDFHTSVGEWKTDDQGLVGSSPHYRDLPGTDLGDFTNDAHTYFVVHAVNLWRYAIAGQSDWKDYTLATTVHILDPAPLDGVRPGQDCVFMNYQWGREAIGSDAGLCVRYQGPDRYYMVRLSSSYQHIELWKTKGGVVCVKPFPFVAGKDYRLSVTANGCWITVMVDGTEIIRYYDPVAPILSGKVALGVRESRVRFSNLQVDAVTPDATAAPAHVANFHLRDWVGRHYIFDGDEPIANLVINSGGLAHGGLQEVKLVPGLMPMMILDSCAEWGTGWTDDYRYTVQQEGKQFSMRIELKNRNGFSAGTGIWTLTYDPKVGYLWEMHARVEVLVDDKVQKWTFNLADPCFYQTVSPATSKMPTCRTVPNYALYTRAVDGLYGWFPTNHQFINNGGASEQELTIRKGGFFSTTVDDWAAVVEVPADNEWQYDAGYCAWGLDEHIGPLYTPGTKAQKGEVFTGHVRYYALPPEKVQEIIAKGVLPNDRPANHVERLVHEEPMNHFTDVVAAVAGDSKLRWLGGYTIDRTQGRNDKICMRIDATDAQRLGSPHMTMGASNRTGPYTGLKYRIGMWVKADTFTGKVTLTMKNIIFPDHTNTGAQRTIENPSASLQIKGKCDWTFVSFETPYPRQAHAWDMQIDIDGQGAIWVDDIEFTPLNH